MALEKLTHIPQEEAEEGLKFLKNGLPEKAKPIEGKQFRGYYSLERQIGWKKVQLTYEPNGNSYLFRNAHVLQ